MPRFWEEDANSASSISSAQPNFFSIIVFVERSIYSGSAILEFEFAISYISYLPSTTPFG